LDVRGCYDNIPRRRLWALLGRYVEPPVLRLLQAFARAVSLTGEGVGQGYPHGPVLANLYLRPVYRPLQEGAVLGYGDDFPVAAMDHTGVKTGLEIVAGRIAGLGLEAKIVHSPAPCDEVGFLSITLRPSPLGGLEPTLSDDCIDKLENLPPTERRRREAGLHTYLKGIRAACSPAHNRSPLTVTHQGHG